MMSLITVSSRFVVAALSYLNGNGPAPGIRLAQGISGVDMATLRRINLR